MTTPTKTDNPTLRDLYHELLDVGSSLHMGCALADGATEETFFLDEKYDFVVHAKDHLQAAIAMVVRMRELERRDNRRDCW